MAAKTAKASVQSVKNTALTQLKGQGVLIVNDPSEAQALVVKWQNLVNEALQRTMEAQGYMSGTPVFYKRTGQYPESTQMGPVTVNGSVAYGTVGYTAYSGTGLYGRGGSVDIPTLIETGYRVKHPAQYRTPSGAMAFDFRKIPYFGFRPGVPVRQMVVSELAGRAAAEGVTISF